MNLTVEEYLARYTGEALQQLVAVSEEYAETLPDAARELPKMREALAIKQAEDDAEAEKWRKENGEILIETEAGEEASFLTEEP